MLKAVFDSNYDSGDALFVPQWVDFDAVLKNIFDSNYKNGFAVFQPHSMSAITIDVNVDLGNIDPALVNITDPLTLGPTVYVDRDIDEGGAWRHFCFGINNAEGKLPTFQINKSTGIVVYNLSLYRPVKTTDWDNWDTASRYSDLSSVYEWDYGTTPFPAGETIILSNPTANKIKIQEYASTLVSNPNASPTANGNAQGVFAFSPAALDGNGNQVGNNEQYAVKFQFGGATTDGFPKRKMMVTAGVHAAGESQQWYAFKGFMDYIINSNEVQAQNIRANWDIWAFFLLNPNGWYGGNPRQKYSSGPSNNYNTPSNVQTYNVVQEIETEVPGNDICMMVNWHGDILSGSQNTDFITYTDGDASIQGPGYDAVIAAGASHFDNAYLNKVVALGGNHDMWYGINVIGQNGTNTVAVSNETPGGRISDVSFYEEIGRDWARSIADADQTSVFNSGSPTGNLNPAAMQSNTVLDNITLGGTAPTQDLILATMQSSPSLGTVTIPSGTGDITLDNLSSNPVLGSVLFAGGIGGTGGTIPIAGQHLAIISENLVDSAFSVFASSEVSGHSISKVKSPEKGRTYRGTSNSEKVTVTWEDAPKIISGVALPMNNLIKGSTVRITVFSLSTSTTPIYDSGAIPIAFSYKIPPGFSSIGSASFGYGGGNYFSAFFDEVIGRKVEIDITTPTSNPDGFIELSRVVIGRAFRPSIGADRDVSIGFIDNSKSITTDAGSRIVNRRPKFKTIRFNLSVIAEPDRAQFNQILNEAGSSGLVFISMFPNMTTDPEKIVNGQIYGIVSNNVLFKDITVGFSQSNIQIEEF